MKSTESVHTSRLAWAGVIGGAGLWGTVGLFIEPLTNAGFPTLTLAFLRIAGSLLLALPFLWFVKPGILKLQRWQDLSYFLITGTISLGLFQWCYLSAIDKLGMSLAVVLLYTAPAMVVVMARFLFGETITVRKIIAIGMMITGCLFVLELWGRTGQPFSISGLLFGLGAAFTFALYNVSSKFALQKYDVVTVIIYTFLFASLGLLPFAGLTESADLFVQPGVWFWILMLMIVPTLLAYSLYLAGLQMIESGRATLAAVIELLVAVLLGVMIGGDTFNLSKGFGVLMVISSVLLISRFRSQKISSVR